MKTARIIFIKFFPALQRFFLIRRQIISFAKKNGTQLSSDDIIVIIVMEERDGAETASSSLERWCGNQHWRWTLKTGRYGTTEQANRLCASQGKTRFDDYLNLPANFQTTIIHFIPLI